MKKIIFLFLFVGLSAMAQVKVGKLPTSLATDANFEVQADNDVQFYISKVTGNVGIGVIEPKTTLDVAGSPATATQADGIMAPRLTRAELIAKTAYGTDQKAALVFVSDLSGTTNAATTNVTAAGYYYFDGTVWVAVGKVSTSTRSFFMPSITIPTNGVAAAQTRDLYADYYAQFNAPAIKSTAAPVSIPLYTASELYYYITYYDTNVFANISINASGVMTYDVIGDATACSFINVVFVPKN